MTDVEGKQAISEAEVKRCVAQLQRLSADADYLLGLIPRVRSKFEIADPEARSKELVRELEVSAPKYRKNLGQIQQSLAQAREVITADPELELLFAAPLTRIENELEEIDGAWPGGEDAASVPLQLTKLEGSLQKIRVYAGLMSLPTLLNKALDQISPGAALDFHEGFTGVLPREEDRQWALRYLQRHPRRINGIVDVESGYVYRCSQDESRIRRTVLRILAFAVLGYGLVYGLVFADRLIDPEAGSGWPFKTSRLTELLIAYTAALAGGGVHLVVDFLKKERSAASRFYWGFSEWLLWIHVREPQFLRSLLSFQVVIIGGAAILSGIDPQTAFFFGYSVDSVLDVIFKRFDTFVSAGSKRALTAVSPD